MQQHAKTMAAMALSAQALEARKGAKMVRKYFDWDWQLGQNAAGGVPYTPSIPLLFGLRESLNLLTDEGIAEVVARHQR